MRLVLKQTLLSIAPAEVVEVSSFKSATELLQIEVFDGVCVDLNLDGEEGSNWVEQLLQTNPLLNVMIYSACNDLAVYQALLAAGVKVLVVKSNQMPILQIGLTHWIKGLRYCCPVYNALLDFSLKSSALPVEVKLNKRELEVYQLMQQGLSSAQMALALTIEKGTVAKYRQRINRKFKSRPSE